MRNRRHNAYLKPTKRTGAIASVVAALAVGLSAGGAHADGESLLSLLDTPSITLACFPSGQVGQGNTFTGTQTVNCSQSATQTSTGGNGGGDEGFTGYEVVRAAGESVPPGDFDTTTVPCPAGKRAIGGGFDAEGTETFPIASRPTASNDAWFVAVKNTGTTNTVNWEAYAICATVDA
ncbi:hypothetical protein Slala02_27720 [Streptomyces lavendulae subsp. lavendulae]|nr:hypothetical protein Slala01_31010 [Streptomyces lavendulae subsp. lavendulae]GLX26952.1 hypothetical protein Slala02_27720 [Streptomyces lavendulae subsp. lavendulae]